MCEDERRETSQEDSNKILPKSSVAEVNPACSSASLEEEENFEEMGPPPPRPLVIYRSLNEVWKALTFNKDLPEVRSVVNFCIELGLFEGKPHGLHPDHGPMIPACFGKRADAPYPFIVVEGLDGTGKTTLTRFLSEKLNMKLMGTPPKHHEVFFKARSFFDKQPETVRRAYYSLGNYLAAHDVVKSDQPVVMDRFWHSTAAYALAHQMKKGETTDKSDLIWPADLLQPDLVLFLQVSEEERLRRHSSRKDFTNTPEEQTLKDDAKFRKNLVDCYRNVSGPHMVELLVDGEQHESQTKILKTVLTTFPKMRQRLEIKL